MFIFMIMNFNIEALKTSYPENCTIAVTFCLQVAYSTINCLCVHLSDLFINLTQVFYIMRKVTM